MTFDERLGCSSVGLLGVLAADESAVLGNVQGTLSGSKLPAVNPTLGVVLCLSSLKNENCREEGSR